MTKKRTQKNIKRSVESENPNPLITPERVRRTVGLFLIFFSLILFISLVSYIFTWKVDQGEIVSVSLKSFMSHEGHVSNLAGRLGAFLSHTLIYVMFGVGAFILPYFFITTGINVTFNKSFFPIRKVAIYTVLSLILLPLFAQFFLPNAEFSVGGGMGKMLYGWLSALLGKVGLGIILIGGLLVYMLYKFRASIQKAWVNYQRHLDEKAELEAERELIGGESLIPEEREAPVPHHKDSSYEQVNHPAQVETRVAEAEEVESEPILTPYVEPENVVFETRTISTQEEPQPEPEETISVDEDSGQVDFGELEKPTPKPKKEKEEEKELSLELEETPQEEASKQVGQLNSTYDHTLELSRFQFPPLELLENHGDDGISIDKEDLEDKKNQIVATLLNYNINIDKIKATVGPTVTLYEIVPSPGVRISKIRNLEDDIALSLAALGIRIIAPIPGKGTIGIEVPNIKKAIVSMRSMIGSEKFQKADMDLPIAIGKTITNEYFIADLAKMPHLLMAGATGQGKSVGLNAILVSLLYKKHPSELKFVLVDPKKVELTLYKKIEDCYLAKLPGEEDAIITDTTKVIHTLNALSIEMDQRYDLLKSAMVRNIKEYNKKFSERKLNPLNGHKYLPYIVLVIDEFADLMMTAGKEIEMPIARLAQLARAVGIHLVIATQRPSVNIITGIIKANFPGRIAFKVASKIDSRTILDTGGADQLIGRGDLLLSLNSDIVRLQCPFVDTPEVESICNFIEDQNLPCETYDLPEYIDPKEEGGGGLGADFERDVLFEEAAKLIVMNQSGSTSLIQRKMSLGYNRAGRIMDQLEAASIVGPSAGSKARDVLVLNLEELEHILQHLK